MTDGTRTTVLSNLEYGNYRIIESVPENFTLDETMTTDFGKQAVLQFNNSMNYQRKPEGRGGLVFTKADAADLDQKLAGSEFTLYKADRETDHKINVFVSDSTGTVTIKDVVPGTYYLKETKAPAGYDLRDERITFTVTEEGKTIDVTGLEGEEGNYYLTNARTSSTPDNGGGGGNHGGGGNYGGGGNHGGGGNRGSNGTTTIFELEIPLASLPGDHNTIIIEDSEIPLAPLPKTGDRAGVSGKLTALVSGILFAAYMMLSSRKRMKTNNIRVMYDWADGKAA